MLVADWLSDTGLTKLMLVAHWLSDTGLTKLMLVADWLSDTGLTKLILAADWLSDTGLTKLMLVADWLWHNFEAQGSRKLWYDASLVSAMLYFYSLRLLSLLALLAYFALQW